MVGAEKPFKPRLMRCVIQRIAGDRVAVAGNRDDAGRVLLAVAIADEAADIALKRRDPGALRQLRADFGHAQIDGDVQAQQRRIDPQIDALGHPV